jgi:N,N'-diacetyllegionaminate synthase
MMPYQILEVANSHGGSLEYLLSLIREFEQFRGYGMKFQPLHPDKIATKDFQWYNVYQELLFTPEEWSDILRAAAATKEIWLDIFDEYGTEIYHANKHLVKGVKLQPSILYNESVISELGKHRLENQVLIINVSGLVTQEIHERLSLLEKKLAPKDIWIEVGFQSYPTELQDCGYVKIDFVKQEFKRKVVFADHADGAGEDAVWLPVFAAMAGADVLEKHICHSTMPTKYDHFSSINVNKYLQYSQKLAAYLAIKEQPFINDREKKYLANSIQIPISKTDLRAGSTIHFLDDLLYRRTGLAGLSSLELKALQASMHLLSRDVPSGRPFQRDDFKKATIATIIACRLKSSRLPRKAVLKIGELPSVERCIKSCLKFQNVNHTILATSDNEEDSELKNHTYSQSVIFHTGDPEDVIRRYLSIIDRVKIDVVIRVTADMPYVSNEIVEILLESHFANGADYTAARESAVGTSVEIINASALRKIKEHFHSAEYSEYMTWYFQNNPEHFKLNLIDLPKELVRNYRLTLDYQEDLEMFNAIEKQMSEEKMEFDIRRIFDFLDRNPKVAEINSHLSLRYKTDAKLIETLNSKTKIRL